MEIVGNVYFVEVFSEVEGWSDLWERCFRRSFEDWYWDIVFFYEGFFGGRRVGWGFV